MFIPILVIVVGIVWLLNNLGVISADIWSIVWPVAVILLGVSMLSKRNYWWCSKHKEDK